ncbi:hypothetical protein ABZ864_24545 [Streptomyces sp. NPDC047082]|uniref:hypothetical protein n=1 Tax=Streptomyces sp. NPDC047082 TaxID=3155259 RepID=UPI00340665CC
MNEVPGPVSDGEKKQPSGHGFPTRLSDWEHPSPARPDAIRAACGFPFIFHGLRPRQLRTLYVTDVVDGRLHIEDRKILLAWTVRAALNSYLAHRQL